VGREKVACWSTKAAISLKHVKIGEKLLYRAYRNSPTLFRTVPSQLPTASPSPRLGVRNSNPKPKSLYIPGRGKETDFKFDRYIYTVPYKSPSKILEKREQGTHMKGASCGHLCGSSAFLFYMQCMTIRKADDIQVKVDDNPLEFVEELPPGKCSEQNWKL